MQWRSTRHEAIIAVNVFVNASKSFGWAKIVVTIRKLKLLGKPCVSGLFTFALVAYNLVRIRNILARAT